MIPAETLWLLFGASIALALAPGPDNLFVLAQSSVHGRTAGVRVTLGLCTGLVVHTAAVALGVAAILRTSAVAFSALKILGVVYLLYLAWHAYRAGKSDVEPTGGSMPSGRRLYFRGIVMNVTNPKVAMFFLAFLPQFADPALGSVALQLVCFGAVFAVAALIVFVSLSFAAGSFGGRVSRSPRAQTVLNRIAGTVYVGLALRLAASER